MTSPPAVVLDMFPMMQILPADRMMMVYMKCCSEFRCLVGCAHMLLDLTVLAESDVGKERRRFGTGVEKQKCLSSSLLDFGIHNCSHPCLFLPDSSKDGLFRINHSRSMGGSVYLKWTARDFARLKYAHADSHWLRRAYAGLWLKMYWISLALSRQIVCNSLVRDPFSIGIHNHDDITWIVPRYRLLEAARLLFGDPEPGENDYLFKPLDENMAPPVSLDTLIKEMLVECRPSLYISDSIRTCTQSS